MRTFKRLFKPLPALCVATIAISSGAIAEQKPDPVIKLGMSVALSGPAQHIGHDLVAGANLYFSALNKQGGINGVPVKLIVLDDGYEPQQTVENTRQFIYQDKVDALFTMMGTPTIHAIKPLLSKEKTPLLMPYTGAEFLHQPSNFPVFNLRASYHQEANALIKYLVEEREHLNIALLIQADEFGLTLESSFTKALAAHNLMPSVIARFRRNTDHIEKALRKVKRSNSSAVAMIGTYKPLVKFMNEANNIELPVEFASVSFASSKVLFEQVTSSSRPLSVSEVVPNPKTCHADICHQFRKKAQHQGVEITHQSFEAYLNAWLFSYAMKECTLPLKAECIGYSLANTIEGHTQFRAVFDLKPGINTLPVYRSSR